MKQLTPQQIAACTHIRKSSNHLAVRARAGTGKTHLLVAMTNEISSRSKSLAVAFNRSNREDLQKKVPAYVRTATLHGLGLEAMIRAWGHKLEIDTLRQRNFAQEVVPISKNWTRRPVISTVCRLVSYSMNRLAVTSEDILNVLYDYGILPDQGVTPEQYVEWARQVLEMSRRTSLAISYDDMVFLPAIENVATGFNNMTLFDEAQDANPAQKRLVLNSIRKGGKIVLVGDDRQGIYFWRGADAHAFDDFAEDLKAEILPLTWCFRCPVRVIELAQHIVPDIEAAPGAPMGKILWEGEKTLYERVQPGEVVIARSNYALTKVCMQLLKRGIRTKIAGRDFGETLIDMIDKGPEGSTVGFLEWLGPWVTTESERLVAAGKDQKAEEISDSAEALRELSEGVRDTVALKRKLSALFVENPGDDVVHLCTAHRAKGFQWGRVWLLESTFRLSTLEERNLYYVAITRVLGPGAPGELILVQLPTRQGRIPPSIASRLLDGEGAEDIGAKERKDKQEP